MLRIRMVVNQHRRILMKRSVFVFFVVLALFPCFALADGWKCEFSSYITRQEYVDVPYQEWDSGSYSEVAGQGAGQGVTVNRSGGYSRTRYRRELREVTYDYPTRFYLYENGYCVYEGTASVTVTNLDWGKSYQVKWYSPSSQQWESGWISNKNNLPKIYINLK